MNVGIVSMLSDNYGALLQSYALQTILERLGCNVIIVNRRWGVLPKHINYWQRFREAIRQTRNKETEFDKFRNEYLNISNRIRTYKDLISINEKLDVVITGSDQVWHEGCSNVMGLYFFLDWVNFPSIKRYSYAASFGKDSFSKEHNDIDVIKTLLQTFTAVSVRESSGIDICKRNFGIEAQCHLDPTLLLSDADYNKILTQKNKREPFVCSYMLDSTEQKVDFIKNLSVQKNCKIINNISADIKDALSVKQWIQNIRDAKYVVTDSFHGTVFSIIFKKNFICINNKKRGAARFESLLGQLGLLDRLINIDTHSFEETLRLMDLDIDYNVIYQKLEILKVSSINYLKGIVNNGQ